MNQELDLFLKEGVRRYLDAWGTLKQFEEKMPERLEGIVKARPKWNGFNLSAKRTAIDSKTGRRSDFGHWSYTEFYGRLESKGVDVSLEIGVWWAPAKLDAPVIFYTGVSDGPGNVKGFKPKIAHPRVKHFNLFKNTYLYIEPGPDMDFDRDFNELLDVLLKQIG